MDVYLCFVNNDTSLDQCPCLGLCGRLSLGFAPKIAGGLKANLWGGSVVLDFYWGFPRPTPGFDWVFTAPHFLRGVLVLRLKLRVLYQHCEIVRLLVLRHGFRGLCAPRSH